MRNTFITLLGLASASLLGNCQEKSQDPAPALTGKRWMLEQVDSTPISVSSYSYDYDSFIQFSTQDQGVSGLAACSAFKGSFVVQAASQQITFTQLTTTRGSCSDLKFATTYLVALPQTQRYEIQGNKLLLYDAASATPRLVFQAAK